ncbi:MAG: hypothetical protein RMZ43_001750 [Nostoc sp. CmiVER01]|uniref:hypothetical protein n=1 Tax=Nostoc sp. CmiVER01 TaxID=3075384 RepID=UPI002AD36319|nr:hypothetical protein [Nostoc sp. CmiVER01]MDZ8122492.1 hypothetical protein [Nostoc sp. CmiVER01]
MRTENFFCFYDICTGGCKWFIFADLEVHGYQGKGTLLGLFYILPTTQIPSTKLFSSY